MVQAEPLDAQIFSWSIKSSSASASTPGNAMLAVLGSRGSFAPLREVPGLITARLIRESAQIVEHGSEGDLFESFAHGSPQVHG